MSIYEDLRAELTRTVARNIVQERDLTEEVLRIWIKCASSTQMKEAQLDGWSTQDQCPGSERLWMITHWSPLHHNWVGAGDTYVVWFKEVGLKDV